MGKLKANFEKCMASWEANQGLIIPPFILAKAYGLNPNTLLVRASENGKLKVVPRYGYYYNCGADAQAATSKIETGYLNGQVVILSAYDPTRNNTVGAVDIGNFRLTQFGQIIPIENLNYSRCMPELLAQLLITFYSSKHTEISDKYSVLPIEIFVNTLMSLANLYKKTISIENWEFKQVMSSTSIRDLLENMTLHDNIFNIKLSQAKKTSSENGTGFPIRKLSLLLRGSYVKLGLELE